MVEEQEVFQITMRSKGARDPRTPGTHVFAFNFQFHRYQNENGGDLVQLDLRQALRGVWKMLR